MTPSGGALRNEERFVLLSGCSGGGKSSILAEIARRGFQTVEEPGRRVVRAERGTGGTDLPFANMAGFARKALGVALGDRTAYACSTGLVFFDRGIVDAAVALRAATGAPLDPRARSERYASTVFLTPPWPEIYVADPERLHGFEDAVAEYDRLVPAFSDLGYEVRVLSKSPVAARVDEILAALGL